jgi:endonuclease III
MTNKQHILNQALTLLKKKFAAGTQPEPRAVLEEALYAIIREGVPSSIADRAYSNVKHVFIDLNEIRVSTVQEVADALIDVPHAGLRAERILGLLQEVFEDLYSFNLDDLAKKGLKQAAKQLSRYKLGVNDFVVAWVTQRALGGHAIPLDEPTIRVLRRMGVLEGEPNEPFEDLEATRGTVEHFITKAKGFEFTEEMIQLADAVCVDAVPHCSNCPMKAECPTGIEHSSKAKKDDKPKPKR